MRLRPPKNKWLYRLVLVGVAIALPILWIINALCECRETIKSEWEDDHPPTMLKLMWRAFKNGSPNFHTKN